MYSIYYLRWRLMYNLLNLNVFSFLLYLWSCSLLGMIWEVSLSGSSYSIRHSNPSRAASFCSNESSTLETIISNCLWKTKNELNSPLSEFWMLSSAWRSSLVFVAFPSHLGQISFSSILFQCLLQVFVTIYLTESN